MTGSLGGALALVGVGATFLVIGVLGAVSRSAGGGHRRPGRPAIVIDLLVGAAATGEATVGFAELSAQAALWYVAGVVLVVAAVVLGFRLRRKQPEPSVRAVAAGGPAPLPARSIIGATR
ncbi:hypothetical protein LQ327_17920 [Actinomycetospora endophytica]|uniref:Uncharacterized protein n=1 Tax=Actinomycetospora endophytica TaxID=2291215 RepID=A0ABS8PE34_9PSEU|nr:hypothetical protein [Actinomycetospora endophytica]MCD2195249.1 hypothetical protein [Actinomycetospora endophytica]